MKHLLFGSILLLFFINGFSQDKRAVKYSNTITTSDLKDYLSVLASDSLEGRETGERGQKMAAAYIAEKFNSFGLEAPVKTDAGMSYFQSYPLKKMTYRTAYLKKGEDVKTNFEDFIYNSREETLGEEYVDILFAGTQTIENLKKMDLSGKFLAVVTQEMGNWRKVLAEVKDLDAAGIILIVEDESRFGFIMTRYSRYLQGSRMALETTTKGNKIIIGNPELASWIFDMSYDELKEKGKGKTSRLILNADMLVEDITAENVLGFLKGSEKPEEVLVVTSHYDHIGISENGEINNGADDDGSGTVTVLEIAQAFSEAAAKGIKPKRSILFMTVSGEEKGLLGSEYYTENPVFPLANTVTNLNVDMVGRVDEEHEKNPGYVYVIGADKLSKELHEVSEMANKTYTQLDLDYTYNAETDPNRYYYRSDHYNFAKKNVPIIFYFNGSHADYHRPTDTIEKINFEIMQKRAQLVFFTAWELANRERRVQLD
ncbi:M28 family peptidase [Marinoscillum sp.]|uniref:M28 family peptidase n=1 Tax=Marinoscillum sp. TaxID=2024838 RepID=UPI003BAB11E7